MTCFPKEICEGGLAGETKGLPNALTFTLIKPGTNLADVEKSPRIVLQDLRLRRREGRNEVQKA